MRLGSASSAVLLALLCACGARSGLLFTERDAGPVGEDASVPETPPICVILDGDSPMRIEIPFAIRIETADVAFLIDATSSMLDEIGEIQRRVKDTIAPGIAREIRNVRFGVAYFGDFPVGPYGRSSDRPFGLLQTITSDLDDVEVAMDGIPILSGGDGPESQVEALYQAATGDGLSSFVDPATCPRGTRGYPCFRPNATPIVLLFTDAPFHNGPGGANPYRGIHPLPHTYEAAVAALGAIGARVSGLNSGGKFAEEHLIRVARDTGAVTADGVPLVFDIGYRGEELDERVIESMRLLAREVPLDVSARAQDVPGDEVNAEIFVVSLTALRAEPPDGVGSIEEATFRDVLPGTTVVFDLVLDPDAVPRLPRAREHWLRIVLVGDDVTPLAERNVIIRISGTKEPASCDDAED